MHIPAGRPHGRGADADGAPPLPRFRNAHRLDGHTPEIGPNGNWWIAGTDTGVPAASLLRYGSYLEFPNVGQANALYLDTAANKLYRWNGNDLHYYAVGTDYNDIKIIDGGNA